MESSLAEHIAVAQQQAQDEIARSLASGDVNGGDDIGGGADNPTEKGDHVGADVESHDGNNKVVEDQTMAALPVEGEKKRKRQQVDSNDPHVVLGCKRLHVDAVLPKRATAHSAGYDLCVVQEATVPARGRATVPIGLAVAIPQGHYGRVAPRSSLAQKGIDVGAGVVDADYRGEVKVVLFNHDDEPYVAKAGDHVAQLIIERIATPIAQWVDDLDDTERGDGGFGSTGR
nr:dUTP pyrophosphatase [Pandoravirus massiliensis]